MVVSNASNTSGDGLKTRITFGGELWRGFQMRDTFVGGFKREINLLVVSNVRYKRWRFQTRDNSTVRVVSNARSFWRCFQKRDTCGGGFKRETHGVVVSNARYN